MGKGICADCYVGNRRAQELFQKNFGGSDELTIDIQKRLERRKKNIARNRRGQKGNKL